MKKRMRCFSGSTSPEVTARELTNRMVARNAAEEAIVLLKNEGVLPLHKGERIGLYGTGAGRTIKGGTGSGDVNCREEVSIYQGLLDAGIEISSQAWIEAYEMRYREARESWKQSILKQAEQDPSAEPFVIYCDHPFQSPEGGVIAEDELDGITKAIYVIRRISGEGIDRRTVGGDYYLSEKEKEDLRILSAHVEQIIVVINAGGQIDLNDVLAYEQVKGLVFMAQLGMEGGNALAEVLCGAAVPCGKLTDTWAKRYEDFPSAETFSYRDGDVDTEKYEEGIYVGYRYFDAFEIEEEYPFGYGLSYTDFSISTEQVYADENSVTVIVKVQNTGAVYAGKEVVQVYATCPQTKLKKEYKRLCGFAKTEVLKPNESLSVTITFPVKGLASFDENTGAWIMEAGFYGIWVGNSSKSLTLAAALQVSEDAVIEEVQHICPLQETLEEITCPESVLVREAVWQKQILEKGVSVIPFAPKKEECVHYENPEIEKRAEELAARLSDEELAKMVIGEISKGQEAACGDGGIMVPGSAGETCNGLEEKWDIPAMTLADGPAGLRLIRSYEVNPETAHYYSAGIMAAVEGGIFDKKEVHADAVTYYQNCTAFPIGTALAQTWNPELVTTVGKAMAVELQEHQVSLFLAPGMNIHRNPLCGRNYEYYSEDPVVSGTIAAAMVRGVQSEKGIGATIKHFACNNQEDNRKFTNSVVSERALREIYLRGFELAVKTAQPMAIMTSYNLLNGVHTPNSKDLCTVVVREEWGFQGILMTDWTTTHDEGGSISWQCAASGNDLIMPGNANDLKSIHEALEEGKLDRKDLQDCVKRLLQIIYQSNAYEDCMSYGARFFGEI